MYCHSRVIFYLNGQEDNLMEAIFGSPKDTVKVSYRHNGVPLYRGFLYETANKKFETGEWVVVGVQSLTA